MCVCVVVVVVVVVVEIITLYQVQTGRFLATTGYVAPSPNHVQNNVPMSNITTMFLNINKNQPQGSEPLSPPELNEIQNRQERTGKIYKIET